MLFEYDCLLEVLVYGLVGYLIYMVYVVFVCVGYGYVCYCGECMCGDEVLWCIGCELLVFGVKEGLSLVNGMLCVMGLVVFVFVCVEWLFDWVDWIVVMSFENLGG